MLTAADQNRYGQNPDRLPLIRLSILVVAGGYSHTGLYETADLEPPAVACFMLRCVRQDMGVIRKPSAVSYQPSVFFF